MRLSSISPKSIPILAESAAEIKILKARIAVEKTITKENSMTIVTGEYEGKFIPSESKN